MTSSSVGVYVAVRVRVQVMREHVVWVRLSHRCMQVDVIELGDTLMTLDHSALSHGVSHTRYCHQKLTQAYEGVTDQHMNDVPDYAKSAITHTNSGHRLHTHRYHLLDKADNVVGVVIAVGIVGDAAAFVGADLILVDNPV